MNQIFKSIPNVLDEFNAKPELRDAFIFSAWRKIAGESLCEHTVPFRMFGKHLIVAVEDKMWKRHLELLSDQMIFKLNSLLNKEAVTFIEFRIAPETVESEKSQRPKKPISDREFEELALEKITPELRIAADAIADDNLRYQFLRAAGGCMVRKDRLKKDSE